MKKIQKLTTAMKEQGIEAVLVSSEINQRYLTGFAFSDGYVLVTTERSYLITDFRYTEAATAAVNAEDFTILAPAEGMRRAIKRLLGEHGVKVLSVEGATLCVDDFRSFDALLEGITLVPNASTLIDGLRLFKDDDEIAKMQKAQDIADAAFSHILTYINPDRTEIDVALELEFFMRAHGAECVSFETIAVSGSASSLPHGVPRPVKLEKGFFTMDFGARVDGYCSDMTRTVVIGRADEEMKHLYHTVLRAQLAALDAAKLGVSLSYLDKVARDIIDANPQYKGAFGHSLGHGVGMYIHEEPRLSVRVPEDQTLQPGHVVTFEPGIYLVGKYGCRIEDMAALREDGTLHNFTHSPKDLIEL
ncbi:MAG: aminopeptidase P family protein [Clostridia bacterium]|nr:aminopeptidase P family protein [Clostridia bacterium]